MNQMLKIYLVVQFCKNTVSFRQKKKEKIYFFFSKKKNEINQTNLSIVHYYHKCYYESLNIFVIQNLHCSSVIFRNSLSKPKKKPDLKLLHIKSKCSVSKLVN